MHSMNDELSRTWYVEPGFVLVPSRPTMLAAIVTSGVVVSLYDGEQRRGGLCHYAEPCRRDGLSTAVFAAPSILCLAEMFRRSGSRLEELEAHLYGGGVNPRCSRYVEGLAERNVEVGVEVLAGLGISVAGREVGGKRGRKVIFCSTSGDVVIARLDDVEEAHWYPALAMPVAGGAEP